MDGTVRSQSKTGGHWSREFLVGIDGGGTRCRARVSDMDLRCLGEGEAGAANAFLDPADVRRSILEAVRNAVLNAGITTDDFSRLHVGMALAGGDDSTVRINLENQSWPFSSVVIDSDAMGACMGAFEGGDGAIQIVGTGSCGFMLLGGKPVKVGSHEFPISDLGSGASMGLEAIRMTLLACDEVIDSSELTDSIYQHFNLDIAEIVHWSKQARPSDYGWFAREVFDCADNGDLLAVALVDQGVLDVEGSITALRNKGATRIALMGSVAQRMKPRLVRQFDDLIVDPLQDAMYGALLMVRNTVVLQSLAMR